MVAHLVRLKVTLLVNGFRRSAWQTVLFVLGALYVLGVCVMLAAGSAALGLAAPDLAPDVVVALGALLVAGWWFGPLIAFGSDATLDPARFVTLGIDRRTLVNGLALGALVGIGGAALVVLAAGSTLAWLARPALIPVAVVGAVLGVATSVLGSRALSAALAPLLERRRTREALTILGVVVMAALWLGFVRVSNGFSIVSDDVGAFLSDLGTVLGWTPFGAPWALAGDVADGAWPALVARLALCVATVAAAWWLWGAALVRSAERPAHQGDARRQEGLGWFGRVPATPWGAVAARAATYWVRDPRYAASLTILLIVPVAVVALTGGDLSTPWLLVAGPVVAWFLGFGLSNEIAYDHTAFALHVAAGVRGRDDRWGRCVPVLAAGAPLVVGLVLAAAALSGRWDLVPVALGVALGVLGASLAVSSVVSALVPYPVPKPGDSPFKSPQGAGTAALVAQLVGLAASGVVTLPVTVLAGVALWQGGGALGWTTALVGVVLGAGTLVAGVRVGGRLLDARGPELLQRVLSYA
ncbi:ABC-2 type transport system permease protein [Sediminihabitans luteus]|uniref:ABC-2 type transport system permease protein n=1 Tax=Sediminihabitans luteus TaxID=1138585 RepID=A0A2M9CYL3_9CELL|nr:hypothetical protein [Sediminihabitans luteus]PJJ77031.1 ABC-2 type transport system permease protein [Sediminihabitans luteus]GII99673.1 hypothetical protein Slu03_20510 [Sediminihabitans luteus]